MHESRVTPIGARSVRPSESAPESPRCGIFHVCACQKNSIYTTISAYADIGNVALSRNIAQNFQVAFRSPPASQRFVQIRVFSCELQTFDFKKGTGHIG